MLAVQSISTENPADSVLAVSACTAQHLGDRPEQQDRVAVLRSRHSSRCVLGLVADGMGGKRGGAIAAIQTVMIAERLFGEFQNGDDSRAFFETMIDEASTVLGLSGMTAGIEPHSTVAAVLIQPGRIDWCHVGDSRIYRLRGQTLLGRTRDHSVVQHLIDSGQSSPERARLHPSASLLTQALGASRRPVGSFDGTAELVRGDRFLICSDGVWGSFEDHEIAASIGHLNDREASEAMINGARQRATKGRGDNCSLVLMSLN